MLKKLTNRICLGLFLILSLSSCSAVREIGNALSNSLKGFSIHFP